MIHTTIGVYSDGTYKSNGVTSEDLAEHIKYNLDARPGRTFIVDGVLLNRGNCSGKIIDSYLNDNYKIKHTIKSRIYE